MEVLYVGIAFLITLALAIWKGSKAFTASLDARAAKIAQDLDEAARLREEAEKTLATYQQKHRDALRQVAAILEQAEAEAQRLTHEAEAKTRAALARREAQAKEKIAQAEAAAIAELRAVATNVAVAAAAHILADINQGPKGDTLLVEEIKNLSSRLN
ncbi:MAG: F0F1 ATP synthase subunit B [Alphaproteobacteria bacterium]